MLLGPLTVRRAGVRKSGMARPTKGCCGTCGYLSRRVKPEQPGGMRAHAIFAEVEPQQRDLLPSEFNFSPGEANAWKPGEYGCFRHEVDLPKEIREHSVLSPNDATASVIWSDRHCPRWTQYEAGLSPRDHLLETRTRDLEDNRRAFEQRMVDFETRQNKRERHADRRLTVTAITIATILGLLTMTKDAVVYPWLHAAYGWLWRLVH
jgi:hypothetical protein